MVRLESIVPAMRLAGIVGNQDGESVAHEARYRLMGGGTKQ